MTARSEFCHKVGTEYKGDFVRVMWLEASVALMQGPPNVDAPRITFTVFSRKHNNNINKLLNCIVCVCACVCV